MIIIGDSLHVLAAMRADSVDAIVTDPPYGLSDATKRDPYCFSRIVAEVAFPNDGERVAAGGERGNLAAPPLGAPVLCRVDGTAGVDARIGVPERAVDFDHESASEQEIHDGDIAAALATDQGLALVPDAEDVEHLGDFILEPADGPDTPLCNVSCRCFAELGNGRVGVAVVVPRLPRGVRAPDGVSVDGSDADVGTRDDARSNGAASGVLATGGTEGSAMLRLHMGDAAGEIALTEAAPERLPAFLLRRSESVGASARAGRLPAKLQALRVRLIDGAAHRTLTLHVPTHGDKSSVARGFMGRQWDGFTSPGHFERWCYQWALGAMHVLKPGGHIVVFGGPRTFHRVTCALEDAGFEIRDVCSWIFGSGFPKSLDVSAAIDKTLGATRSTEPLPATTGDVYGEGINVNYQDRPRSEPVTPEAAAWEGWGTALKPGWEPAVLARKPLRGTVAANVLRDGTGALNIDATRIAAGDVKAMPATERAAAMTGDERAGAALGMFAPGSKPAEDFVPHGSGRWPANVVLSHDAACVRVGEREVRTDGHWSGEDGSDATSAPGYDGGFTSGGVRKVRSDSSGTQRTTSPGWFGEGSKSEDKPIGYAMRRVRTNMATGGEAKNGQLFGFGNDRGPEPRGHADADGFEYVEDWRCVPDCPVAVLDQQSGASWSTGGQAALVGLHGMRGDEKPLAVGDPGVGDFGGASRFFYTAKASRSEREAWGRIRDIEPRRRSDGRAKDIENPRLRTNARVNDHPTVKPLELMAWLVRLVTPPGGLVLDPFAGSGSTLVAARREGFRALGIEQDERSARIAMSRIRAQWEVKML